MTDRKLTAKQAAFVAEYLISLNASEASRLAGYSQKNSDTVGPRLLATPHVAAAIAAARADRVERTAITGDRVLVEAALLSFSDLTHYIIDDVGNVQLAEGAPEGAMRAISSIKRRQHRRMVDGEMVTTYEVEIRLWDKPGPLKLAGQHVGLFKDKVEHTGAGGGPLVISWED